ncbi:hypothetical protein PoB_005900800 [Plakobranchus ocellatus]|uniref:Uncharacterized protein n=1 Tax=Plakobranchus ocellatus TaxID=259542 RepID=A0AAV4CMH9_9GAST|nr:hypothetical protein PoB_005900800 [Plakobranchus ocellatus]
MARYSTILMEICTHQYFTVSFDLGLENARLDGRTTKCTGFASKEIVSGAGHPNIWFNCDLKGMNKFGDYYVASVSVMPPNTVQDFAPVASVIKFRSPVIYRHFEKCKFNEKFYFYIKLPGNSKTEAYLGIQTSDGKKYLHNVSINALKPVHNKVISDFQALRQARTPVVGLESRQKVACRSQGGFTSHCAIDAPQEASEGRIQCDVGFKLKEND